MIAHRITFLSRGSQVGAEEQKAESVAAVVGAVDDGEDIPF